MEFREMRRKKQSLDRNEQFGIIKRGTSGVLSLIGDGGYPYGVPISYIFVPESDTDLSKKGSDNYVGINHDNKDAFATCNSDRFYFHSAKSGHKIDAIKSAMSGDDSESANKGVKASFTIIDRDDVVSDEFTTYFKSLIAFGYVSLVTDEEETKRSIELLARRYSPDESDDSLRAAMDREYAILQMIRFDVEHMTAKEAIELTKRRKYMKDEL